MKKLCVAAMFWIVSGMGISGVLAYDVTENLSIGGVMGGSYQYLTLDEMDGFEDTGKGAMAFQPELSFKPSGQDEIFIKLGFGAGNALNEEGVSPFSVSLWAADLENDVKDLNGRGRDYLLNAWYKHTFSFHESNQLALSGGILDSTDYVDENAFANDEYAQFMNQVFVNAATGFAPSYDLGAAFQWEMGPFGINGVVMDLGENDDGNGYTFYGMQAGYALETEMGEGNYRLI